MYKTTITPSSSHQVGHAKVLCFGPGQGELDWSLNALQSERDIASNLDSYILFCRIRHIAETAHGKTRPIHVVYAPRLDKWNAQLVTPHHFQSKITHPNHPLTLFRGACGAGMSVPTNSAVFFPTGDCPIIVMTSKYSSTVIAAHAGLRELVDFDRVLKDTPSRPHESVVDAMCAVFTEAERAHIEIKVVCGIQRTNYKHPITHPTYGDQNKKLLHHLQSNIGADTVRNPGTEGRICLYSIVWYQAVSKGINHKKISHDGTDTYSDRIDDVHAWWSHRRAQVHGRTQDLKKRNGVLVINPS